jgi:hypothetical protein
MAWYRCPCGLLKEEAPRIGDAIAAIYHIHRPGGPDAAPVIVEMQEVPSPPPDPEVLFEADTAVDAVVQVDADASRGRAAAVSDARVSRGRVSR